MAAPQQPRYTHEEIIQKYGFTGLRVAQWQPQTYTMSMPGRQPVVSPHAIQRAAPVVYKYVIPQSSKLPEVTDDEDSEPEVVIQPAAQVQAPPVPEATENILKGILVQSTSPPPIDVSVAAPVPVAAAAPEVKPKKKAKSSSSAWSAWTKPSTKSKKPKASSSKTEAPAPVSVPPEAPMPPPPANVLDILNSMDLGSAQADAALPGAFPVEVVDVVSKDVPASEPAEVVIVDVGDAGEPADVVTVVQVEEKVAEPAEKAAEPAEQPAAETAEEQIAVPAEEKIADATLHSDATATANPPASEAPSFDTKTEVEAEPTTIESSPTPAPDQAAQPQEDTIVQAEEAAAPAEELTTLVAADKVILADAPVEPTVAESDDSVETAITQAPQMIETDKVDNTATEDIVVPASTANIDDILAGLGILSTEPLVPVDQTVDVLAELTQPDDVSISASVGSEDKHVSFAPGTPEPKPTKRKKKAKDPNKPKRRPSVTIVDSTLLALEPSADVVAQEAVISPAEDAKEKTAAPADASPSDDSKTVADEVSEAPAASDAKPKKSDKSRARSSSKSTALFAAGGLLAFGAKSKSSKSSKEKKKKSNEEKSSQAETSAETEAVPATVEDVSPGMEPVSTVREADTAIPSSKAADAVDNEEKAAQEITAEPPAPVELDEETAPTIESTEAQADEERVVEIAQPTEAAVIDAVLADTQPAEVPQEDTVQEIVDVVEGAASDTVVAPDTTVAESDMMSTEEEAQNTDVKAILAGLSVPVLAEEELAETTPSTGEQAKEDPAGGDASTPPEVELPKQEQHDDIIATPDDQANEPVHDDEVATEEQITSERADAAVAQSVDGIETEIAQTSAETSMPDDTTAMADETTADILADLQSKAVEVIEATPSPVDSGTVLHEPVFELPKQPDEAEVIVLAEPDVPAAEEPDETVIEAATSAADVIEIAVATEEVAQDIAPEKATLSPSIALAESIEVAESGAAVASTEDAAPVADTAAADTNDITQEAHGGVEEISVLPVVDVAVQEQPIPVPTAEESVSEQDTAVEATEPIENIAVANDLAIDAVAGTAPDIVAQDDVTQTPTTAIEASSTEAPADGVFDPIAESEAAPSSAVDVAPSAVETLEAFSQNPPALSLPEESAEPEPVTVTETIAEDTVDTADVPTTSEQATTDTVVAEETTRAAAEPMPVEIVTPETNTTEIVEPEMIVTEIITPAAVAAEIVSPPSPTFSRSSRRHRSDKDSRPKSSRKSSGTERDWPRDIRPTRRSDDDSERRRKRESRRIEELPKLQEDQRSYESEDEEHRRIRREARRAARKAREAEDAARQAREQAEAMARDAEAARRRREQRSERAAAEKPRPSLKTIGLLAAFASSQSKATSAKTTDRERQEKRSSRDGNSSRRDRPVSMRSESDREGKASVQREERPVRRTRERSADRSRKAEQSSETSRKEEPRERRHRSERTDSDRHRSHRPSERSDARPRADANRQSFLGGLFGR